jgi:hypothetical protein
MTARDFRYQEAIRYTEAVLEAMGTAAEYLHDGGAVDGAPAHVLSAAVTVAEFFGEKKTPEECLHWMNAPLSAEVILAVAKVSESLDEESPEGWLSDALARTADPPKQESHIA